MKKLSLVLISLFFITTSIAGSSVIEGVVEKSEVITTQVGSDGKPLLGAAIGVGVGSLFGSGHGKDVARITGGLIGASSQANKRKQTLYGWRYIIKANDELQVVDAWCSQPYQPCSGIVKGKEVYVINDAEVVLK